MALWSGLQVATLVVSTTSLHLWPHQPDPLDSAALAEMVGVQIFTAALLFPFILAEPITIAINVAVAIAFQQLAGVLSATPSGAVWSVGGFVGIWLVGLGGWARAKSGLTRSIVSAGAVAITLGGALLWYVQAEANAQGGLPSPDLGQFGPLLFGIALATSTAGLHFGPGTAVLLPLGSRLLAVGWAKARESRF